MPVLCSRSVAANRSSILQPDTSAQRTQSSKSRRAAALLSVGPPGIGERHLHRPGDFALEADDARHLDRDIPRLAADGQRLQKALLVPLGVDSPRAALWETILLPGLLDGEAGGPVDVIGSPVLVAA